MIQPFSVRSLCMYICSIRHHAAAVLRQQKGPFANAAVFLEVARRVAMLYKLFVGI